MFNRPRKLAPEPFFSGCHYLLYEVALFMRNRSEEINPEQLRDLGDAIHNLPQALIEYGDFFDETLIRETYLAPYDEKWAKSGSFSLIEALNEGIELKNRISKKDDSYN